MDRLINENAVLSAIGEWIAHNEHTYTNATEYLRNRVKAIKTAEQEPTAKENLVVGDCISRQAVSEYVESYIQEINTGYGDLNNHTNRILRMIVDGIDKLPFINLQEPKAEHWIPVSERLPEKSGFYLVTNRANEIEFFSFTGHDMARVFWSKYAKAWMPLPEPYKAESEDKEC